MAAKEKSAEDQPAATPQEIADAENEQGYVGETPDETPNEAYTFAGQAEGAATPETDFDLKAKARERAGLNPAKPPDENAAQE